MTRRSPVHWLAPALTLLLLAGCGDEGGPTDLIVSVDIASDATFTGATGILVGIRQVCAQPVWYPVELDDTPSASISPSVETNTPFYIDVKACVSVDDCSCEGVDDCSILGRDCALHPGVPPGAPDSPPAIGLELEDFDPAAPRCPPRFSDAALQTCNERVDRRSSSATYASAALGQLPTTHSSQWRAVFPHPVRWTAELPPARHLSEVEQRTPRRTSDDTQLQSDRLPHDLRAPARPSPR